jgi:hypothetical protein
MQLLYHHLIKLPGVSCWRRRKDLCKVDESLISLRQGFAVADLLIRLVVKGGRMLVVS